MHFFFYSVLCYIVLVFNAPSAIFADDVILSNASKRLLVIRALLGPLVGVDRTTHRRRRQDDIRILIQNGVTMPFCNMFGCELLDPEKPKCDPGFRYDVEFKRCRKLV
ncbi:hypothetical protein CDAR_492401 [Caerostris darwini]|uniref:Uncharacterized protein n=1 Tax=Caerostris darwini TaxID=1538125 RepID=A0AAV4UZ31_9ARAC|nr:hypothetical protein CDAR_492401 [Caerostris darwini]